MENSGILSMVHMLAQLTPEEILVEQLENCIEKYKQSTLTGKSIKEEFEALLHPCIMILMKIQGKDSFEFSEDMRKLEKAITLFTPNQS